MKFLTQDALLICDHVIGVVQIVASQSLVTVEGRQVLVATDPEGRTISSCPNIGATIKPCQNTLPVRDGYSEFIRVDGARVCLDSVIGFTDGTPPASVSYSVRNPGQSLVDGSE